MRHRLSMLASELPEPLFWDATIPLQINQPYLVGGLVLVLEKLAGDTRTGTDAQGKTWESILPAHYGYIADTVGGDKEALDIYIRDGAGDLTLTPVSIVDQKNLTKNVWDGHKIMLGFATADEAARLYVKAFSDGKGADRIQDIGTMSFDDLHCWVLSGDTTSPIAGQSIPDMVVSKGPVAGTPVQSNRFGAQSVVLAPKASLCLTDLFQGQYVAYLFGPISAQPGPHQTALNDLIRILREATSDTKLTIFIASPGGDLLEAMRLAGAMRSSKAHITTCAVGAVCSAAVVVWAEGTERQIGTCAYFMQHMSSHMDYGSSRKIMQRATATARYVRTVVLQRQIDVGLWTEREVADLVEKATDLYASSDKARTRTGVIA